MSFHTVDELLEQVEGELRAADTPAVPLLTSLLHHLHRLRQLDLVEDHFKNGVTGANVAECIGWLNLKSNQIHGGGLHHSMERGMIQTIIRHLEELHGRRKGADEAKKAEEIRARKAREEKRKAHEEAQRNRQRESNPFNEFFWGGAGFNSATEEEFRRLAEEMFRRHNFGFESFRTSETFQEFTDRKRQRKSKSSSTTSRIPWYEVLGIAATATKAEINKAYRKLANKFHPDKKGGSHDKMAEINRARDEGLSRARS